MLASEGDLDAVEKIGLLYLNSAIGSYSTKGIKSHFNRAAYYFKKLIDNNDLRGYQHLSKLYLSKDYDVFVYLSHLFRRIPEGERTNFVLAAYNAGFGHIHDAMRLSHKYGLNRYVWNDNVETYLRHLNDSVYYTDSLCRNGRFVGTETTLFVRKVQHKYSEYRLREEAFLQNLMDE